MKTRVVHPPRVRLAASAYSIVEVMVAAGLLVMAIAASASLALTMVAQEESNARAAMAINMQEQACRLYQLGLDPDEIEEILPYQTNWMTLSFTTNTGTVAGVGTMDAAASTLIFSSGSPITATTSTEVFRTNTLQVVRPAIR